MKVRITVLKLRCQMQRRIHIFFCNYMITRKDTFTMVTEGRCVIDCCGEMKFTKGQGVL